MAEDWGRYGKWPRMLSLYKYLRAFARSRGRNGRSSLFSRAFLFSSFDFLPFGLSITGLFVYSTFPTLPLQILTTLLSSTNHPSTDYFFFISRTASGKKIYLCLKKEPTSRWQAVSITYCLLSYLPCQSFSFDYLHCVSFHRFPWTFGLKEIELITLQIRDSVRLYLRS